MANQINYHRQRCRPRCADMHDPDTAYFHHSGNAFRGGNKNPAIGYFKLGVVIGDQACARVYQA